MLFSLLTLGCIESTFTKADDPTLESSGMLVEPLALAFGALPPATYDTRTIEVTNTGTTALNLLAIVLEGASDFTLLDPPPAGALSAGASVKFEVAFTAEDLDAEGTVWILTDDPSTPEVQVPVTGATTVGALVVSPNPLQVGHTDVGGSAEAALTIANIGHAPVALENWLLARDEFALLDPMDLPVTIEAQEELVLDIGFFPDVQGIYEAQLWLAADDPVGSHMVALRGTAGDAFEEVEEEEDDCFEPENGYLEHPEARFVINDSAKPVTVTYVATNGAYVNELHLAAPRDVYIATTHRDPIGQVTELGTFNEGEELLLELYVHDTRNTFYSGPASRNPDGFPHVAMSYLGECTWRVGFEDLWNGGDQDFDDIVITISGPLQLEQ